jgi:aspergillopepsin I
MFSFYAIAALVVICSEAVALPDPRQQAFKGKKTFSLHQVSIARQVPWRGPISMRRAYLKYGLEVPDGVARAAAGFEQQPPITNGKTSVPVRPAPNDVEFLVPVDVGNHQLQLDLDTGSSDLYVATPLYIDIQPFQPRGLSLAQPSLGTQACSNPR